jgi:hypothetical protein
MNMKITCGIYGFHITKNMEFSSFRMIPRSSDHAQVKKWARDEANFHLTGVIEAQAISPEQIFDLEGALSFIEHLEVIVTRPVPCEKDDSFRAFPEVISTHKRHNGGGEMLMTDTFMSSRKEFLAVLLDKLQDRDFCEATRFRTLFFKCIEQFLQRKHFLDTSYFLLYSGLETYSRAVTDDNSKGNSSARIAKALQKLGFDVKEEHPDDPRRAVSTYTHLRNAIVHNSDLEKIVNMNGQSVIFKAIDYIFPLSRLVALSVLRIVQFDDRHTNWDSWIDRQAFR